jgi:hypothetical protein
MSKRIPKKSFISKSKFDKIVEEARDDFVICIRSGKSENWMVQIQAKAEALTQRKLSVGVSQ